MGISGRHIAWGLAALGLVGCHWKGDPFDSGTPPGTESGSATGLPTGAPSGATTGTPTGGPVPTSLSCTASTDGAGSTVPLTDATCCWRPLGGAPDCALVDGVGRASFAATTGDEGHLTFEAPGHRSEAVEVVVTLDLEVDRVLHDDAEIQGWYDAMGFARDPSATEVWVSVVTLGAGPGAPVAVPLVGATIALDPAGAHPAAYVGVDGPDPVLTATQESGGALFLGAPSGEVDLVVTLSSGDPWCEDPIPPVRALDGYLNRVGRHCVVSARR